MRRNAMAQGQTPGNVLIGGQLMGGTPVAPKPDPLDQIKKLRAFRRLTANPPRPYSESVITCSGVEARS